ncbi:MAG: hypothetical protein AMS24_03770 [Chlamydiae bacterium SM23_39]|nr:MAG: hypothetical protein AMS24_03770 [Chlamydiae bacterium SM23_39]
MASIYKRKLKKGHSWRVLIHVKGYPKIYKDFERKEEAEDWAKETEMTIKRGRFKFNLHNKLHTLEELIERFLNDGKIEHHKSAKDTKRHLDFWKEKFGKFALVHITSEKIGKERQLLLDNNITKGTKIFKRSPATINRYISSLSAIFSYAKKLKWIDENPCFALSKLKESKSRDRILTNKEITHLLDACKESSNSYLYCIVLIALTTGARKGEILSLKWSDIDFNNQIAFLRHTKNGHPRTIPLVNEIIKELKKIFENKKPNKELIFASKTSFGKIDIKKSWARALKKANIIRICFSLM